MNFSQRIPNITNKSVDKHFNNIIQKAGKSSNTYIDDFLEPNFFALIVIFMMGAYFFYRYKNHTAIVHKKMYTNKHIKKHRKKRVKNDKVEDIDIQIDDIYYDIKSGLGDKRYIDILADAL